MMPSHQSAQSLRFSRVIANLFLIDKISLYFPLFLISGHSVKKLKSTADIKTEHKNQQIKIENPPKENQNSNRKCRTLD